MNEEVQKSESALREEKILEFWHDRDIFAKTLQKKSPKGEFVFYDGPPFATGLPHYGHILASVIKDTVPRYFTMRGYHVPRVWGWDCHGLPIENIVEKELGFKHKKEIREYGVAKFNETCRERVLTYTSEWEKIIPRIGRWVDMKNAYRTMDKSFMESVWWVFKSIYDKGLVYEDYRSMHVCPRCETTLSQQEVSEGYKDVKDIAITVKFKLKKNNVIGLSGDVYALAWTTTPWTLPGNVALAVNSEIEYEVWEKNGEMLLASKKYWEEHPGDKPVTRGVLSGVTLLGLEYEPPFDYYKNDTTLKNRENGWKVYHADFVTADAGTGIAHEAPAFGADDWELLKKENLPFVQHVNYDGTMKTEVAAFAGMEVKPRSDDDRVRLGTDIAVLTYLQEHNLLFLKENITHAYPHCWRCDSPLLNYATSSWFVSVEKIKDRMLKNAQSINWSPKHIKEGRWGKWLEGARDWSISRQRFWASVIPIWVCETCKEKRVFGSASELENASGKKVDDLHKHIVDEITVPCACGGVMRRVSDVLDTWFDSGSMPYGEKHYPFEKKEAFDRTFPAQFIAEGQDQTRAWFYYLHVFATALFNKPAFQNVIVNGIMLAEDGKKMSKRLQNYPDPMKVVDRYGADALRYYLLSSPVVQSENLSFAESGVDEVLKKHINRLMNVLSFYKLYEDGTKRSGESKHVLDRWILLQLDELVWEITRAYERYELNNAVRPLALFVDDLSVWYLRRSRDRLKNSSADQKAALATLRQVLYTLSLVIAPAMPFTAESLYQEVKEGDDLESVHLCSWPERRKPFFSFPHHFGRSLKESPLIADMSEVRRVVSLALEKRSSVNIKVRQPLQQLTVKDERLKGKYELVELIKEEVNVKDVVFDKNLSEDVLLDTAITDALKEEGDVRELVRLIQDLRKASDLSPKDTATLTFAGDATLLEKYWEQISKTTNLARFERGDENHVTKS
ncbi:MAG: isoleucine--tRNA ligase [Patescibacteria group bacterium]